MIHVGVESVFIDADGDTVKVFNDGPGSVTLSHARAGATVQTVASGGSATLRQSMWATSASGAYVRTENAARVADSAVLVEDGGVYPPRPTGGSVVFVGPDDPAAVAQDGDVWISTA